MSHLFLRRGFHSSTQWWHSTLPSPPLSSTTSVPVATSAVATTAVTPVDCISGVPSELKYHSVRIYKPARNTMQSGIQATKLWKIDFDTTEKWHNPLMGWPSSGDPVQALSLKFNSKEDAIRFAEKQGWQFVVSEPHPPKKKMLTYADNFRYSASKLRVIKTK